MNESWASRRARWLFNLYPAYRGTGARVEYIAADWMELRVRVPLSWRTRNYVGTIFGGSLYSSIDPFYMLMLLKLLGPEFIVWDKAATIHFRRPGRTTLRATFRLTPAVIEEIREQAMRLGRIDRAFDVSLADDAVTVHATFTKTIQVRWKRHPGEQHGGAGA
jgi:acyl-coenzyme A thioesterase PaaI-like protein